MMLLLSINVQTHSAQVTTTYRERVVTILPSEPSLSEVLLDIRGGCFFQFPDNVAHAVVRTQANKQMDMVVKSPNGKTYPLETTNGAAQVSPEFIAPSFFQPRFTAMC